MRPFALDRGKSKEMIDIRPGTDADKPQILARIEEVFGARPAQQSERLWDWQWHRDPRLATPGYRGVVAEWQGQIIGNLSTIPAGLHVGSEPVQAWWCVDMLVHWGLTRRALREQKRAKSPGTIDLSRGLSAALLDHPAAGPIQLAKHISDPMMTILQRIPFEAQPDTWSLHRRISMRSPLGRALGARLGDLVGVVADLAVPRIPRPALPIKTHTGPFDARFDHLWESVKGSYPAICRRDAAVLDWRYRQHPDNDYSVLILDSAEGLRGYCVIKVFDRDRRRRGKIVDLLAAPADTAALQALLAGALGALRRQRVERVELFACGPGLGRILADLGFTPRLTKTQRPRPLMVRHLPESARGLYATQGDGDGG